MLDFEKLSVFFETVCREVEYKSLDCEKVGKRMSCIARAGSENYSEAFISYEDEKYALFTEREIVDAYEKDLVNELMVSFRKLLDKR